MSPHRNHRSPSPISGYRPPTEFLDDARRSQEDERAIDEAAPTTTRGSWSDRYFLKIQLAFPTSISTNPPLDPWECAMFMTYFKPVI